jgi:hypothetical protein
MDMKNVDRTISPFGPTEALLLRVIFRILRFRLLYADSPRAMRIHL